MASDHMERIKGADYLLLGLIFAALVAWTFLSPSISTHGEAREGLVVQDIVHDHEWILPDPNEGLPFKPPFFHWIAALLGFLLGLSDFTVRLPSAIAAEVMMVTTFLMGRAIGGRKTAWLAVGALLGMYQFWVTGTEARVDMVLAACVTVSIAGFFFWHRNGHKAAQVTCYIASACAVLAKGPTGIILPGLVIIGFLATERRLGLVWKFWSWPLVGLALLIDVGWYALAYRIGGDEFLRLQIVYENLDHFFNTGNFSTRNNNLTMLGWIVTRTFPWNLALPWALIQRLRGAREDSSGRFLHVWWIAICGFFALAVAKRSVYLLPTYPAIALLAAKALAALIASFAEPSRQHSLRPLPAFASGLTRILQTPKGLGIAVALLDLALMVVNPIVWRQLVPQQPRVAFIQEIGAIVPRDSPLLAAPELSGFYLVVIAYRLQRNIERKPISCAHRNDYFLTPIKQADFSAVSGQVLASSETDDITLVKVFAPQKTSCSNAEKTVAAGYS